MVKSGHTPSPPVAEFSFSNPERPQLGLEVLNLATLRRRLSAKTLGAVHRADFHQLFLCTRGATTTMVDFVDYPSAPGTLLHVAAGRVLRLPRPVGDTPADALMVLFAASFPPRIDRFPTLAGQLGPVVYDTAAEFDDLRRATQDLRSEYRRAVAEPSPVTIELLRQLLGALLLRIRRLPGTGHAGDETFQRFQHELERTFATTRNAADYAARIGYSLRSLNRLCQASTGSTAKTLIDARVALEAKRLLAHTDVPVAAIGHRLGFTEPTNFGKFFARETGSTPGAFRERAA